MTRTVPIPTPRSARLFPAAVVAPPPTGFLLAARVP